MANIVKQATYWSATINNPDENDYVLVRNPDQRFVRQLIWTLEKGEDTGTPHFQMFVRLQRNQTMSFLQKLWPRGHFRAIGKDDYLKACNDYAQKEDATTAGYHVNTINDALPTPDSVYLKVIGRILEDPECDLNIAKWVANGYERMVREQIQQVAVAEDAVEREMVMKQPFLVRLFLSPIYAKIKDKYRREFILHYIHTHAAQEVQAASPPAESQDETDEGSEVSEL